MLFLVGDIAADSSDLRGADGENPVAALPSEVDERWALGFEPDRRASFRFFDHGRDVTSTGESGEEVHMILDPADKNRLAIESGENAAKVGVEFVANQAIAKERSAVFGGKDRVDEYFG